MQTDTMLPKSNAIKDSMNPLEQTGCPADRFPTQAFLPELRLVESFDARENPRSTGIQDLLVPGSDDLDGLDAR